MNIREDFSVLDCTLRDGGHVNGFNFGYKNIKKIITNLTKSRAEIVEIGFLRDCEYDEDKTVFNTIQEAERVIDDPSEDVKYSVMIRPDWYDISKLEESKKVNLIRFAFYFKDLDLTIKQAKIARDLGYLVFLNPVNITGYNEKDLDTVLSALAKFNPFGVSIVDTYGSMTEKSLIPIYNKFESSLGKGITLGLHLHENLGLSFSIARKFLDIKADNRPCVVDTSVLGMGRIPGNLPSELVMEFANRELGKRYEITNVLNLVSDPISKIKNDIPWGYSSEYAISAYLGIHRSYPEYLISSLKLEQDRAFEVMNKIADSGKGDFFSESVANEFL
jgi:isopropylmalate/homocitrate/citramalate synthase